MVNQRMERVVFVSNQWYLRLCNIRALLILKAKTQVVHQPVTHVKIGQLYFTNQACPGINVFLLDFLL